MPGVAEHYDTSEEALYVPVSLEELSALIQAGGRPVLRDSTRLTHLLKRVAVTLKAAKDQNKGHQRTIIQLQEHLNRVGLATTLNPVDALRYLDDDQRELLFDRISRDRLRMLRQMTEKAEKAREDLLAQAHEVRQTATQVAQRPDLPADIRAEFTKLLARLPDDVPPVDRPALLDYPDLPEEPRPAPPVTSFPAPVASPQATAPAPAVEPDPVEDDAAEAQEEATPVWVDPFGPTDGEPVYRDPLAPEEEDVPPPVPRTGLPPAPVTDPPPPVPRKPFPPPPTGQSTGLTGLFD